MIHIPKKSIGVPRFEGLSKTHLDKYKGKKLFYVVHPFFEGKKNAAFEEYLKSGKFRDHVVVVSEEWQKMGRTRKKLERLGVKENDPIYLVSTDMESPVPSLGWDKVISTLNKMDLKYVVVGGRKLKTAEKAVLKSSMEWKRDTASKSQRTKDWEEYLDYLDQEKVLKKLRAGTAWGECVGGAWGKLAATTKHKVHLTNRFT